MKNLIDTITDAESGCWDNDKEEGTPQSSKTGASPSDVI